VRLRILKCVSLYACIFVDRERARTGESVCRVRAHSHWHVRVSAHSHFLPCALGREPRASEQERGTKRERERENERASDRGREK